MHDRPMEELRPAQIVAARERSGCAFVPVSPTVEWHSYHLPTGTDALVSEALCRLAAERVGGVWLRPLPLGLDEWRPPETLRQWGFNGNEAIFGMRFPGLPLTSEYGEADTLHDLVACRIAALKGTGFRHVFLVNHHGGRGQHAALDQIAAATSDSAFHVYAVRTYQFNTLGAAFDGTGGHAGYSETHWVLAFRPELVDTSALPAGTLSVREFGILHDTPLIPEKYNPRNCSLEIANALRENVVENFVAFVQRQQ